MDHIVARSRRWGKAIGLTTAISRRDAERAGTAEGFSPGRHAAKLASTEIRGEATLFCYIGRKERLPSGLLQGTNNQVLLDARSVRCTETRQRKFRKNRSEWAGGFL